MSETIEIKRTKQKPLSSRELAIFSEQVAMIIQSGMLIHTGLQMITDDTTDPRMKKILQEVSNHLEAQESLSQALALSGVFPDYLIHMVSIGTESGRLDSVMRSLSDYYSRQHTIGENLKSAIVYPAVLIFMMLTVLIFLVSKVLPIFQNVFQSLGTGLSSGATSIMSLGTMLAHYSFFFVIIVVFFILVILFLYYTEKGRRIWGAWLAQRKLSEKFSISAFASSMALMLSSGLDTEHSMKLSVQMIPNNNVKSKVNQCIQRLEGGNESFISALENTKFFSNTTMGILSVGSKCGTIDSAMQYVADIYEDEFQSSVMKKISLIEPISVATLSVLIGIILISVMFPLLGVMSSLC